MYRNTLKSLLTVHASNIPGWRTKRKIVVIESEFCIYGRRVQSSSLLRLYLSGRGVESCSSKADSGRGFVLHIAG